MRSLRGPAAFLPRRSPREALDENKPIGFNRGANFVANAPVVRDCRSRLCEQHSRPNNIFLPHRKIFDYINRTVCVCPTTLAFKTGNTVRPDRKKKKKWSGQLAIRETLSRWFCYSIPLGLFVARTIDTVRSANSEPRDFRVTDDALGTDLRKQQNFNRREIPMEAAGFDVVMKHPRSIIHLDVDCFYAQVEMLRHPEHIGKPLGVQQKNIVVTSNYIARQFGVTKCMSVEDALSLCPGLVLVNGQDLTNYRRMSTRISELLLEYTPLVERLGLDESYVDVSAMVEGWKSSEDEPRDGADAGHFFGATDEECPCGCHARLCVAGRIARDMRRRIYKQLGLTCSAGIGHNKLIAKLAGSLHKPNDQTLVYPWAAAALLSTIGTIGKIPGIGPKTLQLLSCNDIRSIDDLRRISLEELESRLGSELSRKLKDNAEGIDEGAVKPSGRPQSIGLEDGFNSVSLVGEVEARLGALLRRLTELATEDGRIPVALKVTVRKSDSAKSGSTSKRETRQCALPQHLLPSGKSGLYDYGKMLALAMKLFHRAVDVAKPFHLTLLGVAFTKFEERNSGRSSITSFLRKQVAVQSVLDISSEGGGFSDTSLGSPMSINQDSNDAQQASSCSGVPTGDCSKANFIFNNDQDEDIANEIEPSPKKTKLEVWLSGRRESPSNEMAGLRLGPSSPISTQTSTDSTVFKTLPIDLQREVSWQSSKTKPNNILKYFIANK